MVESCVNSWGKYRNSNENRHDMLVSDYAQNLDLPHFGEEQPGDSYYFSPLFVNVFGVVNCATDVMNAYTYHEGEGDKGGNNVVSLLWKYLKNMNGWEYGTENVPGKKLTLVFDNC